MLSKIPFQYVVIHLFRSPPPPLSQPSPTLIKSFSIIGCNWNYKFNVHLKILFSFPPSPPPFFKRRRKRERNAIGHDDLSFNILLPLILLVKCVLVNWSLNHSRFSIWFCWIGTTHKFRDFWLRWWCAFRIIRWERYWMCALSHALSLLLNNQPPPASWLSSSYLAVVHLFFFFFWYFICCC